MATFTTVSTAPCPPAAAFDFICDLARWPLFRGYGPLPGIAEASLPPGESLRPGVRIRVRNSDGSVHHELVEVFEPGRRYVVRMELAPPPALLMSGIEEAVEIEPAAGGALIRRRFTLTPRSPLLRPLVALVAILLRRAVERHNADVAAALAR